MSARTQMPSAEILLHEELTDGRAVFRLCRRGSELVATWPGLAQLTCTPDGRRSRLWTEPGAPQPTIDKLRGTLTAFLHDLQGGFAFHASAVTIDSSAALIIGRSGAGKSTMAADLCMHHGCALLADDAACVELRGDTAYIVPSETKHYLTLQSRRVLGLSRSGQQDVKHAVTPARVAPKRARLALVVSLRFEDGLERRTTERLGPADAFTELLQSMVRFDKSPRKRDLNILSAIFHQAPFVQVARPYDAQDVAGSILELMHATR